MGSRVLWGYGVGYRAIDLAPACLLREVTWSLDMVPCLPCGDLKYGPLGLAGYGSVLSGSLFQGPYCQGPPPKP